MLVMRGLVRAQPYQVRLVSEEVRLAAESLERDNKTTSFIL